LKGIKGLLFAEVGNEPGYWSFGVGMEVEEEGVG
jgi:hypothetical protein